MKSVKKKWKSEKKLQKVKEYFSTGLTGLTRLRGIYWFGILLFLGVRFPAETARNVLPPG
jgi:hypothetical protein